MSQDLISDTGPGALTYSSGTEAAGRYTVQFDKPAIAVLIEVTHVDDEGARVVGVSKYDDFLRVGNTMVEGTLPTVRGTRPVMSVKARIRYVEYQDGSTEGDLAGLDGQREFEPLRAKIRAQARRYAEVLRAQGRARALKTLRTEKREAEIRRLKDGAADEPSTGETPEETVFLDEMALAQVEANFNALVKTAALIDRLEQLSK